MKHVVLTEPGRFELGDSPEPVPGPGEALVQIHRIGVCGTDLHAFAGRQPFFNYPRILGHELGAEVLALGPGATGVNPGDRCSIEPYLHCGVCRACRRGRSNCCESLRVLGVHTDGAMRPRICVPADKLHVSGQLSYDQLALVETLGIGAHAVQRAAVTAADRVVVIGAGPIGLGVVQFALARGAAVVVVDLSPSRRAFVQAMSGVVATLEPGDDLPARLRAHFEGDLPDVVLDATGNARSMAAAFSLPANGGRLVFVGLFQGDLTFNDPEFHRRELTVFASRNATPETFRELIRAMEAGHIDTTPWITTRLQLEEVPARFAEIARDPGLLKAIIEVPAD